MSVDLGALDEYFDPGLKFTLRGQEYTIAPPSAEVGLWCERLAQIAGGVRGAKSEEDLRAALARVEKMPQLDGDDLSLQQRVLGPTYDQLVADSVDFAWVRLITMAAFAWIVSGDEEAALRYLRAGGRPEAQAPNRAARRASRSTGGATTTKPRASSSGTRSRKTTPPPARATRSRGSKS